MSKPTRDTVAAMQAADRIVWSVEPIVCDSCEETCWTLEGRALGDLGSQQWETVIAWGTHLASLTMALTVMIRTSGAQASRIRTREIEAYVLEHQEALW